MCTHQEYGQKGTFKVRCLEMRDFQQFDLLLDEVDRLHREALPQHFKKAETPARTPDSFSTWLADPNTGLFGADREGNLIGVIYTLLRTSPVSPLHVVRCFGLIDVLVVASEAKRAGVGAALVKEAQAWAKNKGATYMEINVYDFNAQALGFYEKQGYRTRSRKLSMPL